MRGLLRHDSSECLLYALKTSRMLLWTTEQLQYGISIIKTQRDKSRSNRNGHSMIHRWTDLPKGAYWYTGGRFVNFYPTIS